MDISECEFWFCVLGIFLHGGKVFGCRGTAGLRVSVCVSVLHGTDTPVDD